MELGLKGKDSLKGKEADSGGADGDNEFMNAFFQEVGSIKATMSNIRRNVKLIEEKYVQSLNSISIDQGSSIQYYGAQRYAILYGDVCEWKMSSVHFQILLLLEESGNEIQKLIDETNKYITEIRGKLDDMKKGNTQYAGTKVFYPPIPNALHLQIVSLLSFAHSLTLFTTSLA